MNEEKCEEVNAPNWLKELEAKRERRVKGKLGHETGAGSPCLECKDRCPGLDLHFWRKICKNCKCGKENHDVHDDDLHGWAQFQLLGSKPKKPQKIILPGKKDEVELEWAPKGSREAVESYLKDLPDNLLPIKGSQAAQERKQLLQKQMPVHDVDPALCDDLTEEESKQMNEYIQHLKEESVGVGKLMKVDGLLVKDKVFGQLGVVEEKQLKKIGVSKGLEKCFDGMSLRHDYENIDEFGRHKLEASLEELERIQKMNSDVTCSNPLQAQYAMLLDKSSIPLKDQFGAPIKTSLDIYGNPILDYSVLEKIGPLAKAEFAILLDKNGAPIFNTQGNPIKNPVVPKAGCGEITDKFGNKIRPQMALLLDKTGAPLKDKTNSPVKVNLDGFTAPIIPRNLTEVTSVQPQYAKYQDRNGAPVLNQNGDPIIFNLDNLKPSTFKYETPSKFARLLDKNRLPIVNDGQSIITNLDPFGAPILNENIAEQLKENKPFFAEMLGRNGETIIDPSGDPLLKPLGIKDPVFDKSGRELRPKYGLLLRDNAPIRDQFGKPVGVQLDVFRRPIIDESVLQRIGFKKPEFSMPLQSNGAAILDQFGAPVKDEIFIDEEGFEPKIGIFLDKNLGVIKDPLGALIKVDLDENCNPIMKPEVLSKLKGKLPEYVMPLTSNMGPIYDEFDIPKKKRLEAIRPPIYDKFGNKIQPVFGLLLDKNLDPVTDPMGSPIMVDLDVLGRPIIDKSVLEKLAGKRPEFVKLLDRNGAPIIDKSGKIVKEFLEKDPKFGVAEGVIVALDALGRPVIDEKVLEKLHGKIPDSVALLDEAGEEILDENQKVIKRKVEGVRAPIYNKFGQEVKPKYALPLDKNWAPILSGGEPIQIALDALGRPIIDQTISSKVGSKEPYKLMLLDENREPILDKFNRIVHEKLPVAEDLEEPKLAVLFDKNKSLIVDARGIPVKAYLDYTGQPIIDQSVIEALAGQQPEYAMELQESDSELNVKDPAKTCHRCHKNFVEDNKAVEIERSEAIWHVDCFKCKGCNQKLADFVYCFDVDSDDVYCLRDYAKIRGIPRCNACDELIRCKEYCLAEHETYHVKHFCCFECDLPLAGQNYVVENKQPFCIRCYENLKADQCAGCRRIIKPDEQGVNVNGTHFHTSESCFCCTTCRKPLLAAKVMFKNLKLYCSAGCYQQDQ